MDRILTGDVWQEVAVEANRAKRRLVAVGYVSNNMYLRLREGDALVCDASDHAITSAATSAEVLNTLVEEGVQVRSRPGLHAKMAVFGRHAIIGSCNLSMASATSLTELALLTDRREVVAQATAFIYGLREQSDAVDADFLNRIRNLKVARPTQAAGRHARKALRFGQKVWLVSVRELPTEAFREEQKVVDRATKEAEGLVAEQDVEIAWLRFTGKSQFRLLAMPGDQVIQIFKPLKGPVKVYPPYPVIYRQDKSHWTRFFVAEAEGPAVPWAIFAREAKKHHVPRISQSSVRELGHRESLLLSRFWR